LSIAAGVVFAVLLGVGFMLFAEAATQHAALPREKADGIVVLTGTHQRIHEAARLLASGYGGRLLVSGVNPQATGEELRRIVRLDQRLFSCCVDLGYEAKDTIGNAEETRTWVDAHGYASVIVVTSDFHMPRSLAELGRAMPDVRLVPHPVPSRSPRGKAWWRNPSTLRVLAAEYVKFLPAAARYAAARLVRVFETRTATAAAPAERS
jgi:uncharacterized SAM-binding protein YcdF (DUF218 family)